MTAINYRSPEQKRTRDEKLLALFAKGLTNEQVGVEFGCCTRAAGCHRARLLNGGKVPEPGSYATNTAVKLDNGSYMAFVKENDIAPPEEANIRVVRYRPLPATAISYARVGSAAAMCAAIGERRAA